MTSSIKARTFRVVLWYFVAMLCLMCACDKDSKPAVSETRHKAEEVVRQACEYLAKQNNFKVVVSSSIKMQMQGTNEEMNSIYQLAVERPNKMAMILKEGKMGASIISDGKHLYTHVPMMEKYSEEEAAETLDEIIENSMILSGLSQGTMMFILPVIISNPYALMMDGVLNGEYLGTEEWDGVQCHRLKFYQETFDWEMWVETGENPLIRKILPDMSKTYQQMGGEAMKNMQMSIAVEFKDWQTGIEMAAGVFSFTPPPETEKIDSFFEEMMEEEKHPLVGKVAPDSTLTLMDGSKVSLSKHQGKDVVMLDFWASWCGPCVQGLPELVKIADDYKKKNVVFYAINVNEDKRIIEQFLKDKKLSVNVALDGSDNNGEKFQVGPIPQTVIIDKNGKIQSIHLGYAPFMKKKLRKELDAVLEGKDLVGEKEK